MTNIIMVVDDDAAIRTTLEAILIDDGRDVISAEDGLQAVTMASEGPIALSLNQADQPQGKYPMLQCLETRLL